MMDHTHSTPILPDSVPTTSSANKESSTRKDSVSSSLKSNNQNTDHLVFVYLLPIYSHLFSLQQKAIYTQLQHQYSKVFLQLIYHLSQILIQITQIKNKMNHHINLQQRDISSSEDHCRCEACKNQEEFKNFQRQNPTNIHLYKHLKKRGVPPVKKELFNKDLSRKAKDVTKKEELRQKLQPQKTLATPTKHKLIQVLRSKQTPNLSLFVDYHPVSHSQRQKLLSNEMGSSKIEQPRRISNIDESKSGPLHKQHKPKTGATKLVAISQNPQNIKLRYHNSRSLSQASASHNDLHQQNSVKSLQKVKP